MTNLFTNLSNWKVKYTCALLMFVCVGVGNMWGATKSFTPTNFNGQGSSSGGSITYTNTPITVSSSKGYGYSTGQTRIITGGTLVVSCSSGYTISGIALTFTSSSYQGGLSTSYTGLSTTSWTSPATTSTARISGITVTYEENPKHTLSKSVSPAESGSVSLSATSVAEGGTATATATPNSGYRFSSWSISGTGASLSSTSSNPTTVTMGTANATVKATFVAKDCTDKGTSSITSTSGNSCDYGPVDSYYKYSTRQILYKKSELDLSSGKKGIIKSIYFKYKYTSAMTKKTNVNIYMANTNLSSLSSSSYVPYANFTLVYSGSLNCTTTNNWNEFFLDTPFEYNGTGNLVVLIDDNSNAYDGNSYTFYYHSATGAQIFRRSDTDNQNPSTADWTTYSVQHYRPSTKFCIEEIGSCSADPEIGNASLNGSFNMTTSTSAIGVQSGTCSTGNAACDWTDYGFVWSDGANTTTPTVSNNKVQVNTTGSATSWTGSVTPSGSTTPTSWTTGHTYYVRTYGKNSKASATYYYGSAWSFTPYLVTFNKNDGGATTSTQYVQGGVSTPLTSNSFSRTGYTFNGWNTDADGTSGTGYTNGQSVSLSANLTLYAKWSAKTTTVSFNQNSGTGGQTGTLTATYGSAMPGAPVTCPTRTGYNFGGYYDGSGGTGTQYYTNAGASARSWDKDAATATLYAKWTAKSFTVTWMVNGVAYTPSGSGGTDGSTSVDFGSHVATLPTAPTPPCGDKFVGWSTTNIGAVGQATDAGLNLFTTAGDAPVINAEGAVTYYAVFADYDE